MNQIKIGKFIAERRKAKKLTQLQLAENLGITDRAISKWENGKGMPDSSLMLDLCAQLGITVNELLCGEVIKMADYNKKAEQQLLEMADESERKDKELLHIEIFIGILISVILIASVFIASYIQMAAMLRILMIAAGFIPFVIGVAYAIKIEQIAGFYKCKSCQHKFVPTYTQTLFSMHFGRTRYMKCPKCGKKSWCKKILK